MAKTAGADTGFFLTTAKKEKLKMGVTIIYAHNANGVILEGNVSDTYVIWINVFIGPMIMPLKNCPYKVSWILTLTEVISIRILRMRLISAIMSFYWSHAIALQKLSNERSYKFSWILTLTEVISFRDVKYIFYSILIYSIDSVL